MAVRTTALFAALVIAPACLVDDDKGPEDEVPTDDGKFDSQLRPIDHGAIGWDAPVNAVLTDTERFHAWEFELSGEATVQLTTSYTIRGQRKTDTVLYLYSEH